MVLIFHVDSFWMMIKLVKIFVLIPFRMKSVHNITTKIVSETRSA